MSDLMAHVSSPAEILTRHGRCGGLIVSSFVSGKGRPSSSPCRGHCVVFLGKTLYSQSAGLSPPRCINGCDGRTGIPSRRKGSGKIRNFPIVSSCYRYRDKLRPGGPLDRMQTLPTYCLSTSFNVLHIPTKIRFPIGGERVTCNGTKLTNSLRANSLAKQQLEPLTCT